MRYHREGVTRAPRNGDTTASDKPLRGLKAGLVVLKVTLGGLTRIFSKNRSASEIKLLSQARIALSRRGIQITTRLAQRRTIKECESGGDRNDFVWQDFFLLPITLYQNESAWYTRTTANPDNFDKKVVKFELFGDFASEEQRMTELLAELSFDVAPHLGPVGEKRET